jgi:hypothetical protein
MKTKEAMEVIDEGWVRKPKGFRVHFQRMVHSELVTDFVPDMADKPLTSDVTAWRLAWKLHKASATDPSDVRNGDVVNIYVVDDTGEPVRFYGSGQAEVYSPYPNE